MNMKLYLIAFLSLTEICYCQSPTPKQLSQSKKSNETYPLDLKSENIVLPDTEDPELIRVLKDKNTVFYKLPQVWQHFVPASQIEEKNLTLGTVSYKNTDLIWGIYSVNVNPDSHANFNFPWETTAGLNSVKKEAKYSNVFKTINFINLPTNSEGDVIPIWIMPEYPVKWIYPIGTTVGEIIYVVHNDINYVQEIRTRKKDATSEYWTPFLYRPIKNKQEYIELTGQADYKPAMQYMFFRNPQEDEVFKMDGLVERLPPLSEKKVQILLSQKFKNVTDEDWSPSSDQDFHILPKNYCFSLIGGVDSINCANCHQQTQISVRNLVPKDPSVINDPKGTGNIRGSDAVFTWHPFSQSCIRTSTSEEQSRVSFRKYDTDNKMIYFSKENPNDKIYKLTLFVQKALKKYELPKKAALHKDYEDADNR